MGQEATKGAEVVGLTSVIGCLVYAKFWLLLTLTRRSLLLNYTTEVAVVSLGANAPLNGSEWCREIVVEHPQSFGCRLVEELKEQNPDFPDISGGIYVHGVVPLSPADKYVSTRFVLPHV